MECRGVPINKLQSSFNEADIFYLMSIRIGLDVNETIIPADLLGQARILKEIILTCEGDEEKSYVTIDPNAFRSTANITRQFHIVACNLHQFQFNFLNGFEKLSLLTIHDYMDDTRRKIKSDIFQWSTLPPLPCLSQLRISSMALYHWKAEDFPNLLNGLTRVLLDRDGLEDSTMDLILDWLLQSSADTLMQLDLSFNKLTRVPKQVPFFKKLNRLNLQSQQVPGIRVITAGSLWFQSSEVTYLDLSFCNTRVIEQNAFKGICGFGVY